MTYGPLSISLCAACSGPVCQCSVKFAAECKADHLVQQDFGLEPDQVLGARLLATGFFKVTTAQMRAAIPLEARDCSMKAALLAVKLLTLRALPRLPCSAAAVMCKRGMCHIRHSGKSKAVLCSRSLNGALVAYR